MPRLSRAPGWSEMTPAIIPVQVEGVAARVLASTWLPCRTRTWTEPWESWVTYVRMCLVAPAARLICVW